VTEDFICPLGHGAAKRVFYPDEPPDEGDGRAWCIDCRFVKQCEGMGRTNENVLCDWPNSVSVRVPGDQSNWQGGDKEGKDELG
jgi:hypothetical protein